jgi:hypothetical protein
MERGVLFSGHCQQLSLQAFLAVCEKDNQALATAQKKPPDHIVTLIAFIPSNARDTKMWRAAIGPPAPYEYD